MKAIMYVRVSSREQAEEGFSIESQQKLLRDYAVQHGLELVKEFSEVESAKQAGRPAFNEMLAYLRAHATVRTILCEKTDRLYRNFKDYVALDVDQYGLTVVLVKEGETISKDSKSHQKLIHGLKVLLAKNYIDNLKEETGKGLREKAEQGEFPSRAPLGYRNNKETKRIEVNADQAPFIRRLFELYATGEYSLTTVKDKIAEEGLRAKGGRKLHKAEIEFTLHNPIYHGYFRWHDTIYKGVHEPIISKDLFDRAQAQFKRFNMPKKTKRGFPYAGMMTCGSCGCAITAEIKKGKYVYYHCTHGKGGCASGSIRQEALEEQFGEIIRRISIDDSRLEWFKKALAESHALEKDHHNETVAALYREHQQLQHWLDIAYEDRLNGVIDAAHWADASMKWKNRQASIMDALKRLQSANSGYLETGNRILELSNKAYALFKVRDSHEKRQLLNIVLSNSVLTANKVIPTYKRPFDILVKGSSESNWLRD